MSTTPTTPAPPHKPQTPSELIIWQWRNKQTALAQLTEKAIREDAFKQRKSIKLASCVTEAWLDRFITVDPRMIAMKEDVRKLQPEDDPVLITGPTGTGKEIIANALHGSRFGKFVPVNCTALPSELLESELFGHKKGAFTGANDNRIGKFQSAANGTLFLDEIGDMPLDMQAKLLRVLQEKKVSPLGDDNEEIAVTCRIVAATNRTTDDLLNKCHFRADLFYRLSVFIIETTALWQRQDDIEHIVDALGGHELVTKFSALDSSKQGGFDISGNVRSLQAQVRRYQVLGRY